MTVYRYYLPELPDRREDSWSVVLVDQEMGILSIVSDWGNFTYAWDAKRYAGPHPVVAHPDCGPWSKLRHMCTKQDEECGVFAALQVRRWGGVLEHPAHSKLWEYEALPGPGDATDHHGGRTYAVDQCDWGHKCRKPTWLYVCAPPDVHEWVAEQLAARHGKGTPTHCVCTGPRQAQRLPVATKLVKRLTPAAFAELLIQIALRARR